MDRELQRQEKRQEITIALLKGFLGAIPYCGPLLAEIAGVMLPNKWIEKDDSSSDLSKLLYVKNKIQLYDIIRKQSYDYASSLEIRQALKACEQSSKIIEMIASLIVEVWETDKNTVAILSNMLSTQSNLQDLNRNLLNKLQSLCTQSLRDENIEQIGIIEPLVFVLANRGINNPHRKFIQIVLENSSWRLKDFNQTKEYYGSQHTQLLSFGRHINDSRRTGLLQANDIARLILSLSRSLSRFQIFSNEPKFVLQLLNKSLIALQKSGENELCKLAIKVTKNEITAIQAPIDLVEI